MRWLTAASAAIFMFAPAAVQAADLPAPVAPGPAVYASPTAFRTIANWSGFYVGGNVGVGAARDHSDFSAGGATFATADTSLWGAAVAFRVDLIGSPAPWSWARKAISVEQSQGQYKRPMRVLRDQRRMPP